MNLTDEQRKAALEAFKIDDNLPDYFGEEDFTGELLEAWERWLRSWELAIEYATNAAYKNVEQFIRRQRNDTPATGEEFANAVRDFASCCRHSTHHQGV